VSESRVGVLVRCGSGFSPVPVHGKRRERNDALEPCGTWPMMSPGRIWGSCAIGVVRVLAHLREQRVQSRVASRSLEVVAIDVV
jgi:hypothetical protein